MYLSNKEKIKIGVLKKANEMSQEELIKIKVEQVEITQSQALIEIANHHASFFMSENEEMFATVSINGIKEHYSLNSSKFKKILRMYFYQIFNKPIGNTALAEAIDTLIAYHEFNCKEFKKTFVRVAGNHNTIYIDLGTQNREIIEVNKSGWEIKKNNSIKFIRPNTFRPLPIPVKGGSISDLDEFLNIKEEDRILIYSFLLSCFSPMGPYPILILQGPQGVGKSFFSNLIKRVVDPAFAPIRSLPRNEEDLAITAQKMQLLVFDNLSSLGNTMSDSLCKLSTGGGYSTRKLFENTEEVVLSILRPVILNGIDYIARRPDLADRAIIINLSPINDSDRLPESEVLHILEQKIPRILGALLDALSFALRNYDNVELNSFPRMADFVKFAAAAEIGFGYKNGTFFREYTRNRKEASEEAVEHDLLVSTIIDCLDKEKKISGTATSIIEILRKYISVEAQSSKYWIKTPNLLKDQLTRIQPILTANCISYEYHRNSLGRIHTLEKI